VTNIQESADSMQANMAERPGVFTPSNVFAMDIADADLGAAGVLVVPKQSNGLSLATILSKNGCLFFLLNRDILSNALDMQHIADGCWCGPSYFRGSDRLIRIVSAGAALQI
jgi:hypothetical protein